MEPQSQNFDEAFKRFSDWVETVEKRLDSACHCCPTQTRQPPKTSTPLSNGLSNNKQHTIIIEEATGSPIQPANQNQSNGFHESNKLQEHLHESSPNLKQKQQSQEVTNKNNFKTDKSQHTKAINNNNRNSPTDSLSSSLDDSSRDSKSLSPAISSNENQAKVKSWNHVIKYHQELQAEIENLGNQLNSELKRWTQGANSSDDQKFNDSLSLENRWYKLWLVSLEQLVFIERTRRCPKHNSIIIGKPSSSQANKSVTRLQRRRPISYPNNHSERLEWDYRNTLSLTGCHKENGSQIDLDSVDEQITRNLTEFGENYEIWLGKEDEIACVALHSRPPSVEPAEKPEIAKAVVTSDVNSHQDLNCNLLVLTTPPSMFSVDAMVAFSAIYHEPHQMHKSYYHSTPPV